MSSYPARHHSKRPSDGSSRFDISLSRVVLPQPDGPIRVTNSPWAIVSAIGPRARVPSGKIFSADSTSTAGAVAAIGDRESGSANKGRLAGVLSHRQFEALDEAIRKASPPVDLRLEQSGRDGEIVGRLPARLSHDADSHGRCVA